MEWPKDALDAAYEQVIDEPIDALTATHKRVCLEFSPRPQPPIGKITAIIIDEGKKLRMRAGSQIEDDWRKLKGQPSKFGHANSEHAKLSIRLIEGIISGRLNRNATIEGMGVMEKKFPDMGWKDEMMGLIRYYNDCEAKP
jgi:hypothetical protein